MTDAGNKQTKAPNHPHAQRTGPTGTIYFHEAGNVLLLPGHTGKGTTFIQRCARWPNTKLSNKNGNFQTRKAIPVSLLMPILDLCSLGSRAPSYSTLWLLNQLAGGCVCCCAGEQKINIMSPVTYPLPRGSWCVLDG